jgi:hypothetical protein
LFDDASRDAHRCVIFYGVKRTQKLVSVALALVLLRCGAFVGSDNGSAPQSPGDAGADGTAAGAADGGTDGTPVETDGAGPSDASTEKEAGPPDFSTDANNCGDAGVKCKSKHCVMGSCAFLAFVTSAQVSDGAFGGTGGGDMFCKTEALKAGITGSFKAMLSDDMTNAKDRFDPAQGPYYNTQGALYASSMGALFVSGPTASLLDETGLVGLATAYTGTANNGLSQTGLTCTSWSATNASGEVGNPTVSAQWAAATNTTCQAARPLYCFQVP